MKTLLKSLTAIALLTLITVLDVNAQTVVNRARVGGYAEEITFVTSGPLKDQLVMMNGYELYSVDMGKKGVLTRVCKLESPEIDQFVNGLTFVPSEGLFVMNNAPHPDKLFFFDQACGFKGTRPIQYLDSNYRPGHIEGMAYIPNDAPVFPDHLIMVAWDALGAADVRLEIMRRDGVVVAEIHRPDWPIQLLSDGGTGDVMYLGPNRLLLSAYHTDSLWISDFSGNIVSGPLPTGGADGMGEGILRIGDGRIVATDFPQDLLVFDKNLNRQPQDDRHDVIGANVNVPNGIAWDSDANRFIVTHDNNSFNGRVSGLSETLTTATPIVDLSAIPFTRQTVYLPQEDLIGVLQFGGPNVRAILLFNTNGTLNSQIPLGPAALGQNFGQTLALAYLPTTDEFVVAFGGAPGPGQALERLRLRVISRAGALVRTIDLTGTGTAGVNGLEYFEDPQGGGGRLLLISAFGRIIVTDLDGNSRTPDGIAYREFNSRVKFGLITRNDIAAITSGPLAGAFALVDSNGGEVVIFRLN